MGIARYIRVGRDRADLGPAHAGELAAQEANRYAQLRPLDQVLAELHHAWSIEAGCIERLTDAEQRRDLLVDIVALTTARDATVRSGSPAESLRNRS